MCPWHLQKKRSVAWLSASTGEPIGWEGLTDVRDEHVPQVNGLTPNLAVKVETSWSQATLLHNSLWLWPDGHHSSLSSTGKAYLHHQCSIPDVHGELVCVPAEVR